MTLELDRDMKTLGTKGGGGGSDRMGVSGTTWTCGEEE